MYKGMLQTVNVTLVCLKVNLNSSCGTLISAANENILKMSD